MITKNGIDTPGNTPIDISDITPKCVSSDSTYLSDRNELLNCNNRLERYIATQRAKDQKVEILEAQIEELRNGISAEKERIRNSVKNTIDKLREKKNITYKKYLQVKTSSEKYMAETQKVKNELQLKSDKISKLEKQIFQLIRKRGEKNIIIHRLNGIAHKYREEITTHKKQASLLDEDYQNIKRQRDKNSKELNELRSQKEKWEQDENFQTKTYQDMVQSYENEIKEMKKKMIDIEDGLRIDFAEQLDETLKSRQKIFNEEKDKALGEMIKLYEAKVSQARKDADKASMELEETKAEMSSLEEQVDKLRTANESMEKELHEKTKRVVLLEQKITALKLKPIRKEQHQAHVLKLMKEAYRKKEAEIEAERNEKIALKLEIRSYRVLLDKEDNRIKSLKKNHRNSLSAAIESRSDQPQQTPSLKNAKPVLQKSTQPKKQNKSQKKRAQKDAIEAPKKRAKRSRRSSGRPEGVPRKDAQTNEIDVAERKEAEKSDTEKSCTPIECFGNKSRIEIRNEGNNDVVLKDWNLQSKDANGTFHEIEFPPLLKQNESFLVYPNEEKMKADKSVGIKKVWIDGVFKDKQVYMSILNNNKEKMFEFGFSDNEEMPSL